MSNLTDTTEADSLNQRIIDCLKVLDRPIRLHALWKMLCFKPRHYSAPRTRVNALSNAGVIVRTGEYGGCRYQLVEGF